MLPVNKCVEHLGPFMHAWSNVFKHAWIKSDMIHAAQEEPRAQTVSQEAPNVVQVHSTLWSCGWASTSALWAD